MPFDGGSDPGIYPFDLGCGAGGQCMVAWATHYFDPPYWRSHIQAVRLDSAGFLDPAPIELAKGGVFQKYNFQVAASDDSYLVLWREPTGSPQENELRLVLVGRDGSLQGTSPQEDGSLLFVGFNHPEELAWNGPEYLLLWRGPEGTMIGRISRNGHLIDRFTIGGWEIWQPSIALREPRRGAVAFSRLISDEHLGSTSRVFVRFFGEAQRRRGARP